MKRHSSSLVIATAVLVSLSASGCSRPVTAGPRADANAVKEIREKLAAKADDSEAESGDSEESSEAAGWSTLSGRFAYVGTPPMPAKIRADKDPEVCGKHQLFDESIVVGPDGGLANTVVFLRTSKPNVHPDYEASAAAQVVLDNHNCRFEPHVQVLRTSQTLLVKNSDPVGHNSNFAAANNGTPNPSIPAGAGIEQKFPKPEAMPVKIGCNIHPWMGGWLIVRNDPYAAVSDSHGRFKIEKLPAGTELEFQLWQEKATFLKGVELAGAPGVKVDSKGRFKVKLQPDQTLELEFRVPAEAIR